MSVQNQSQIRLKAAVSVSAMAKMISMSKSSFYDYISRGVFPYPLYSLANRRPLYPADMQQEILAVRQTGIGCNGQYVLFYDKHQAPRTTVVANSPVRREQHVELIEGLKSLGLSGVTPALVDQAIGVHFPSGTTNVDEAVVLRLVYRHIRNANSG